jgi:hypothetical protein
VSAARLPALGRRAALLAFAVVAARDASATAMAVISLAAVATFFAVALAQLAITGRERLVYYHHEIAVLAVAGAVAAALQQPVLTHLDATAIGLGAFLAFGRAGCFLVGCCHGRPHRRGVRYEARHCHTGRSPALVGVRLFPLQLLEAALVALIVAAGASLALAGATPGSAFTWYVAMYAVVRFFLELARGDADRPYWRGFSQPQWLSLACAAAVAAAAAAGVVPWHPWDAAAALLVISACLIALRRRQLGTAAPA